MRITFTKSWCGIVVLAIVVGLLSCPVALADSLGKEHDGSGVNAGLGGIDPFAELPGAGSYSDPNTFALANYWFSIISNPWNNYSLIVELFGEQGAAALWKAEEASPLLHPQEASGGDNGGGFAMVGGATAIGGAAAAAVPEPGATLLMGAGLLALAGFGLSSAGQQKDESV